MYIGEPAGRGVAPSSFSVRTFSSSLRRRPVGAFLGRLFLNGNDVGDYVVTVANLNGLATANGIGDRVAQFRQLNSLHTPSVTRPASP
jgi:hypothetical protein